MRPKKGRKKADLQEYRKSPKGANIMQLFANTNVSISQEMKSPTKGKKAIFSSVRSFYYLPTVKGYRIKGFHDYQMINF